MRVTSMWLRFVTHTLPASILSLLQTDATSSTSLISTQGAPFGASSARRVFKLKVCVYCELQYSAASVMAQSLCDQCR